MKINKSNLSKQEALYLVGRKLIFFYYITSSQTMSFKTVAKGYVLITCLWISTRNINMALYSMC